MSTERGVLALRVLALSLLVCLGAACGIGTDDSPRALPASTTTSTTTATNPGPERAELWFIQAEKLVPVVRQVASFTPEALMEELLQAPDSAEGEGLSNAIPGGTELLGVESSDGIARVDLSAGFQDVVGPGLSRAIGQIVTTLTGLESVDAVRFAIEGEPIDVTSLDPDRGTVSVVNACDYAELLAEPLGETTRVSSVQEEILEIRRTELRDSCSAEQ